MIFNIGYLEIEDPKSLSTLVNERVRHYACIQTCKGSPPLIVRSESLKSLVSLLNEKTFDHYISVLVYLTDS